MERRPVIVCVCRNLNQTKVLEAIEDGAASADDVHATCGVEVNCGCCLDTIDDMIACARASFARAAQ